MLPSNKAGLPDIDRFQLVSFSGLENMFKTTAISKYAYVYMAQPIKEGVPAFSLACLGTDNKFTAEDVLKRWKYIMKN